MPMTGGFSLGKSLRIYVMTHEHMQRILTLRFRARYKKSRPDARYPLVPVYCAKDCGFPIQIGDIVASKYCGGSNSAIFHRKCLESCYIDL